MSEREVEQSKLRHDLEVIRAYGEDHLEEWTDVYFENDPTVRLVALFAGTHHDEHERVLRALVAHPDQLVVREAAHSREQLDEMIHRVRSMPEFAEHKISQLGSTRGRLHLQLRADQERLASTMLEQFDGAIDLEVGRFPYPLPAEPDFAVGPNVADSLLPLLGDDVDLELADELEVASGRTGRGVFVFTNHGEHELVLDTNGALTARVVDPSNGEVVGGFAGMQAAPLIRFTLAIGAKVSVPVLVGTASFKRSLGYAVPPGNWSIEATLKVHGFGDRRTPLLPLVIVAASD